MDIKCTPQELKELIENKRTPVAGTTDVNVKLNGETIFKYLEQTGSESKCYINTPQIELNNIISDFLATDDKHKAD